MQLEASKAGRGSAGWRASGGSSRRACRDTHVHSCSLTLRRGRAAQAASHSGTHRIQLQEALAREPRAHRRAQKPRRGAPARAWRRGTGAAPRVGRRAAFAVVLCYGSSEPGLSLSGSWQQGHSAAYSTPFLIRVVCRGSIGSGP